MAKNKSETSDNTKIRRIKATDDTPVKRSVKKDTAEKPALSAKDKKVSSENKTTKLKKSPNNKKVRSFDVINEEPTKNPFKAFARYVKGAWYELRQVRWPNRAATWSMTAAILAFTMFFVVLIVLLDTGFNWLFEQILK